MEEWPLFLTKLLNEDKRSFRLVLRTFFVILMNFAQCNLSLFLMKPTTVCNEKQKINMSNNVDSQKLSISCFLSNWMPQKILSLKATS